MSEADIRDHHAASRMRQRRSAPTMRARRRWSATGRRVALWCCWLALLAPGSASAGITAREASVFEALLNHGLDAETSIIVLAEHTTGDPAAISEHRDSADALVGELGVPAGVLSDWIRRNATTTALDRPLRLDVSYQLLDAEQRAALFESDDPQRAWSQFFERYRGAPGFVRLSRAGFDATFAHALVYVEHACGAQCGSGRLVHLSDPGGGAWQVQAAALVWMAE